MQLKARREQLRKMMAGKNLTCIKDMYIAKVLIVDSTTSDDDDPVTCSTSCMERTWFRSKACHLKVMHPLSTF